MPAWESGCPFQGLSPQCDRGQAPKRTNHKVSSPSTQRGCASPSHRASLSISHPFPALLLLLPRGRAVLPTPEQPHQGRGWAQSILQPTPRSPPDMGAARTLPPPWKRTSNCQEPTPRASAHPAQPLSHILELPPTTLPAPSSSCVTSITLDC